MRLDIIAELVKSPEREKEKSKERRNKSLLRSRLMRARRIPYTFITERNEEDGGWYVKTSEWRRGPVYYHVYRTVFGIWLCTCEDYVYATEPIICKHAMAVALMLGRGPNEKTRALDRTIKLLLENENKVLKASCCDH